MSIATPSMIRAARTCANTDTMMTSEQASFGMTAGAMLMLPGTDWLAPRAAGRTPTIADAVRRLRDVAGSLCLLALALPLMLVVACLIKLDSRGPVLYRQDRVGRLGQVFTLLK